MLVRDIMQGHPVSATVETRLPVLLNTLQRRGFRDLPVLDGGKLVGILSDRDIKRAMTSAALATTGHARDLLLDGLTAGQIMTRHVTTIGPTAGVEEAARLMATEKISAVPVTEDDRLLGIVTESDVLGLFVRSLGVLEPSSRVEVIVPDPATKVSDVAAAVEETSRISSVMTLKNLDGERELVLRLATIDPAQAVKALESRGYVVRHGSRSAPS